MSFLHPLILGAGLAALAIPVLVHLLRRRRRPIPWAAMRFLQEAVRKRRRRLRLEQLLLFLTRCAVVALVALAVARPVLGGRPGAGRATVLVLAVDDSIASALADASGRTALARSIERARRELDAVNPMGGDRVGLVTLGSPGRALVWPPTGDADAVRRALDRLQPTDSAPTLAALRRAVGELDTDDERERLTLRLLGDWRGVDPERLFAGAPLAGVESVHADAPAADAAENIGVRVAAATTPTVLGGASALAPPAQVEATLVRSVADAERRVDVEVIALPGGAIAGRTRALFGPGEATTRVAVPVDEAAMTPGRGGRVALEVRLPGDANPRDDAARAVLAVRRELRVGVVERPPPPGGSGVAPGVWALAALTPDERAGVDAFRIDPASLGSVPPASVDALIVLEPSRLGRDAWARVRELLARGGLVAVTPDAAAVGSGWGEGVGPLTDGAILPASMGPRDADTRLGGGRPPAGVLSGLAGEFGELARAVGVRRIAPLRLGDAATVVLATDAGDPFLAQAPGPEGRGVVAVFAAAFDLDWTDLPARPAFVPVMQELVRRGAGLGLDAAVIAGAAPPEEAGVDRWVFDAELSAGPRPPEEPGARSGVLLGLGPEGTVTRAVAINPDADAARTQPASPEALLAAAESALPGAAVRLGTDDADRPAMGSVVRGTPAGDRLALLLLAAAAALAVFEAVLARAASHPEGGTA